jgi:hypothetical protein
MKPLPAIGAGLLAAFLLLSPVVMAAGPTISVSPSSMSGSQTITISGTTTASAVVGLKVTNPSGTTVFVDNVQALSTGAFTDSFAAGGSAAWVSGIYTASATVNSVTGTTTFAYTATSRAAFNETAWILDIAHNQTIIEHNQANILGNLSAISTALASVSSALRTLSTAVGNIQSSVASITSTVGTISTGVNGLSSLGTQLSSATNSISSTQTYVLVVAVLAAIALVLELAILVRKLS